ncbi:hypothetical protein NPIL_62491 [Nephila pilipes]|uniref:Uncharacterized protein n=1 Tax=Nephila pilipes TaxID=299642 RepID=A0A8X6MVW4_NEPPI|nr:hypothetical protein NPIL_62491 [Nephila pilipes]
MRPIIDPLASRGSNRRRKDGPYEDPGSRTLSQRHPLSRPRASLSVMRCNSPTGFSTGRWPITSEEGRIAQDLRVDPEVRFAVKQAPTQLYRLLQFITISLFK